MQLTSDSFANGGVIPAPFAFGKPGDPIALSDNRNPHLAWRDIPDGTRSFVLTCVDPDVPSKGDDVNQTGRTVPADLPRVEFVHWVMVDIPRECGELGEGSCSDGIVAHGKVDPVGPPGSRQGLNDYTGWFAGDEAMRGEYYGYDGPCPPWNDAIVHHYHFAIHALDVVTLNLTGRFDLDDVRRAMTGHVLARAEWVGTYAIHPEAR
ncbi:MAG TPA: YbhB/YbcL family Raf kinase inhibitor-like protein [Rhodanobacteraceae bacterium]